MEFLHLLFSNVWAGILVILFFGGSVFVHELGHFLAARRRGVHVERFSIGFGPKIFSWRGKDGVEYRISWLPLGGYVALPQLADMSAIEGENKSGLAKLPPPSYSTKFLVFVAGAVFNVIFAFLLACVLWGVQQRITEEEQTTRVGVVAREIELPDGTTAPGPAFTAGIQPDDVILTVDGKSVSSLSEIGYLIALGSGRGPKGEPKVNLTLTRGSETLSVDVFPQYVSAEKIRDIGLEPSQRVMIGEVLADSPAAAAGLQVGDIVTAFDGQPVRYTSFIPSYLRATQGRPASISILRDDKPLTLQVVPRKQTDPTTQAVAYRLGVTLQGAPVTKMVRIAPWVQIKQHAVTTWRTFESLASRGSDIGLSKMSGPIGIAERIHTLAKIDIRWVLWFTILINVNLAIFNLLPIPVLDGGHILFATIGKLRGRALPSEFIATTQSIFIVLLFSMIIYVSFFDMRRIIRENRDERPAAQAPAQPAPEPPKAGEAAPVPAPVAP